MKSNPKCAVCTRLWEECGCASEEEGGVEVWLLEVSDGASAACMVSLPGRLTGAQVKKVILYLESEGAERVEVTQPLSIRDWRIQFANDPLEEWIKLFDDTTPLFPKG